MSFASGGKPPLFDYEIFVIFLENTGRKRADHPFI